MLFADRSTNAVCTIGRTYNMQTRATTISYGLAFIDRTRCIKLLPSWSTESKSGYVKCSETDCFGPSRRRQRWSTATADKVVEEAAVAYRRCGGGGYGGGGGGAAEDNAVVYRRRRLLRTHRMTRADALPSCNLQYRVQVEPTSDHVQSVFCEPSRCCYNNTARRDHFCQTLYHRESNITKILHSLPSFEPFIVDITVNRNKSNMPLFGKSQKNPVEVVKQIKEAVVALEKGDKKLEKAQEDVSKNLLVIKNLLYGTADTEPLSDIVVAQLAQEMYNNNLLLMLIQNLTKIDFEGKKDVAQVFNNVLRRQLGSRSPTVEHICAKSEILFTLIAGYEHQEIALNCGTMLRECARYEALAKILLYSKEFFNFFRYVEVSTFDIASDAFSTFKELLTRHKPLCAEFLEINYDKVFTHYQQLLNSENYVTRRQSLKLLGELLLDRHNFTVMTRYISNPDNLKLMMNMLKEKSRNIQFEAFHVFKVFVANPNKPKPILDILLRNQDKLVEFLTRFHTERSEDEQFNDEKAYLIKQIKELKTTTSDQ